MCPRCQRLYSRPGPTVRNGLVAAVRDRSYDPASSLCLPFKDSSSGCPHSDEEYREGSRRDSGAILASTESKERQAGGRLGNRRLGRRSTARDHWAFPRVQLLRPHERELSPLVLSRHLASRRAGQRSHRHSRRPPIGDERASGDSRPRDLSPVNAGLRVAPVADGCSYTPPNKSRCFSPRIGRRIGVTTRRMRACGSLGIAAGQTRGIGSVRMLRVVPIATIEPWLQS
jgi:hypothetical protein